MTACGVRGAEGVHGIRCAAERQEHLIVRSLSVAHKVHDCGIIQRHARYHLVRSCASGVPAASTASVMPYTRRIPGTRQRLYRKCSERCTRHAGGGRSSGAGASARARPRAIASVIHGAYVICGARGG